MPTTATRQQPADRDCRFVSGRVEIRARAATAEGETATKPSVIVGYGALFNVEAVIGSWFREVMDPHCFDAAIERDDVRGLFNHDPNLILGRNKAGTLRLMADETGLRYEIDPPDTSYAADLAESIGRGDVTGSSFSFRATREEWTEPERGSADLPLRRVMECELYDVAPVTYPAYEETSVSLDARSKSSALAEASTAAPTPVADLEARARGLRLRAESASL